MTSHEYASKLNGQGACDAMIVCGPADMSPINAAKRGVIHVGASTGQERTVYADRGLNVLWIEPIPEVFQLLDHNIRDFPSQRAIQALVSDVDNQVQDFYVTTNFGQSSSMFPLAEHLQVWPSVSCAGKMAMSTVTLDTLVKTHGVDLEKYCGMVVDTQGAELNVLRGAADTLKKLDWVVTEIWDFQAYAGCTQYADLQRFMASQGFSPRDGGRVEVAAGKHTGDVWWTR